jgi:hypothetical protein
VRDDRDVAIIALLQIVLLLIAVTCVTILFVRLAEPPGGLIELLFPRVGAEYGRPSGVRRPTIEDPAVIQRIPAHLGLPGTRDGPPPPISRRQ